MPADHLYIVIERGFQVSGSWCGERPKEENAPDGWDPAWSFSRTDTLSTWL